jgi:hypothetical protein
VGDFVDDDGEDKDDDEECYFHTSCTICGL